MYFIIFYSWPFLVPYVFAIHYSSILVLLQSIYLTWTPAISPFLLLQDSPPPFGARFSPVCPLTHNAPWASALEPSRHSSFPRLSLTALIVTSSQKSAWHRLSAWQELNANVGAPLSRGIYIQIPPHCDASMPIGQRARGISTPRTHSLASALCFWATERPRSGITGCDGIYAFINVPKAHKPTFHRLCVLSLCCSLAFTESVGDFIF